MGWWCRWAFGWPSFAQHMPLPAWGHASGCTPSNCIVRDPLKPLAPTADLPPPAHPIPPHPHPLSEQVATNGTALRSLHDPTGKTCTTITSATQVGSTLYLGSLGTSWVCAVDLSQLGQL